MENQEQETNSGFSLDFLMHPERDFQLEMLDYIRTRFPDFLDDDSRKMLESGDPRSLDVLSQKCQELYRNNLRQMDV